MCIVSVVRAASSAALLACVIVAPSRAAELAEGMAFRSDIRVRHETYNRLGALTDEDYSRARVRLRVGADMKLDDGWDLSFRLATGRKPTSTNQDLNALNDEAELYLDRAFLRFHAGDEGEGRALEVFVGRAPNPYVTSFMLWDADFNPDGLAERLVLKSDLSSRTFFVTAGQHVLGLTDLPDGSKTYGPGFFAVQPGVSFEAGRVAATVAAGYYSFVDVDGLAGVPEDHGIADLVVKAKWSTASELPLAVKWWMKTDRHSSAREEILKIDLIAKF